MWRIISGFLIAPAAPLVVAAVYSLFTGVNAVSPVLFAVLFYGYPKTVLLGLPLYFVFQRRGWLRWWQITLVGAAIGEVAPLLQMWMTSEFADVLDGRSSIAAALVIPALGGGMGAISGFAFWFVVESRFIAPAGQSNPLKRPADLRR